MNEGHPLMSLSGARRAREEYFFVTDPPRGRPTGAAVLILKVMESCVYLILSRYNILQIPVAYFFRQASRRITEIVRITRLRASPRHGGSGKSYHIF